MTAPAFKRRLIIVALFLGINFEKAKLFAVVGVPSAYSRSL
jgi:hypothetical protein